MSKDHPGTIERLVLAKPQGPAKSCLLLGTRLSLAGFQTTEDGKLSITSRSEERSGQVSMQYRMLSPRGGCISRLQGTHLMPDDMSRTARVLVR